MFSYACHVDELTFSRMTPYAQAQERAEAAVWYRLTRRVLAAACLAAAAESQPVRAAALCGVVGRAAAAQDGAPLGIERDSSRLVEAFALSARRAAEAGLGAAVVKADAGR